MHEVPADHPSFERFFQVELLVAVHCSSKCKRYFLSGNISRNHSRCFSRICLKPCLLSEKKKMSLDQEKHRREKYSFGIMPTYCKRLICNCIIRKFSIIFQSPSLLHILLQHKNIPNYRRQTVYQSNYLEIKYEYKNSMPMKQASHRLHIQITDTPSCYCSFNTYSEKNSK